MQQRGGYPARASVHMDPVKDKHYRLAGLYLVFGLLGLALFNGVLLKDSWARTVPYSAFLDLVRQDRVQSVDLRNTEIYAVLKKASPDAKEDNVVVNRLPNVDDNHLLEQLQAHGVEVSGKIERTGFLENFLMGWLLPLGIIMLVWSLIMRRVSQRGPLSFGRNRAKIYDASTGPKVTFADVAGVDEAKAELVEVVDFLKNPDKYRALGARIPKGVLLVGAPGTGKTLLARAVAGEAGSPFFTLSGSEFVEMFVGVGAARMRDLFEQAKQRAPCIVFIDELDAVGKSRGAAGALAVHDEREQTLNQLLVEMDGFDGTTGVILMAATNRPEVLDRALLRPGRFDRQVLVDRPDLKGREEILLIHTRHTRMGPGVDLHRVAQRTPGMVGADLANVVNEAALAAARRGSPSIFTRDFEEAIDRMQLGLKKVGGLMNETEKRRVAYHEAGHALVALSVPNADPVHRVTITRRSIGALGHTLQLPMEDRYLMTAKELRDRICVMLGGRTAELLEFQDVSTGAQNDLERASETARQMVCFFGMSEELGPTTYGRPPGMRMLENPFAPEERRYSDETAHTIDVEVRRIIDEQQERAWSLLQEKRGVLVAVAQRLLEVETLEQAELEELVHPEPPEERAARDEDDDRRPRSDDGGVHVGT